MDRIFYILSILNLLYNKYVNLFMKGYKMLDKETSKELKKYGIIKTCACGNKFITKNRKRNICPDCMSLGPFWRVNVERWKKNSHDEFYNLLMTIKFNVKHVSGVYCVKYYDKVIYVGESVDTFIRMTEHLYNMTHTNYWGNLTHYDNIEFKLLEHNIDTVQKRHELELYWINKLQPRLQKCNGWSDDKITKDRDVIIKEIEDER